jgi:molybdopterin molybdotransferase
MTGEPENQRIARLTPLADVLAMIDAVARPVAVEQLAVSAALGGVLAADVTIRQAMPAAARALRDGWAVASELTADANTYAPVPLPHAVSIETGMAMPPGTDAVAAVDAVTMRSGMVHALAPVAPGEGVLPAGGDAPLDATLLQQGCFVLHHHAAVLAASGVENVSIREPHIRIVSARGEADPIIDAAAVCIGGAVSRGGGVGAMYDLPLEQALTDAGADAVIVIGGTGGGEKDAAVRTLSKLGEVKAHGIALSPGETAAFGTAAGRPVLALPGRLDAALAVWHLLGMHLTTRLSGSRQPLATRTAQLTHKITSNVGMSELIPVRCDRASAMPIASGYVPLSALARADGWVLVPPTSEGFPAGSEVVIRPFP